MSNNIIQVKYDELAALAKQFAQIADRAQGVQKSLKSQVELVQDKGWQSPAATRFFAEMMDDVLPAFDRFYKAMAQTQTTIQLIAKDFQEAEQQSESLIKDGESVAEGGIAGGVQSLAGSAGVAAAATAGATVATTAAAPVSYPDVEALNLSPTAKAAAIAIKEKYPDLVLTSGRRDIAGQARAMAPNIVAGGRSWVTQTYPNTPARAAILTWLKDNPQATSAAAISKGIEDTLTSLPEAQQGQISKHLIGAAFDIQPRTKDAAAITAELDRLARESGGRFLPREGGLVRWHIQFPE